MRHLTTILVVLRYHQEVIHQMFLYKYDSLLHTCPFFYFQDIFLPLLLKDNALDYEKIFSNPQFLCKPTKVA